MRRQGPDCLASPRGGLTREAALAAQHFMLTAEHRAALKADTGVESWHFEQHADEAVFIPAGCPHQARPRPLILALKKAKRCFQPHGWPCVLPSWGADLCMSAEQSTPGRRAPLPALCVEACACVPAHA